MMTATMPKQSFNLKDKADWWRAEIEAGRRTAADMEDWLIHSDLEESEVGKFQYYYQNPEAKPWELWFRPDKVKSRYGRR